MCDTLIATPLATKNNEMIFAKNSDREPNEAQNVTFIPAKNYPQPDKVKCTYIEIPQVEHTNAVLLSKPFWMFGAEMGVNEKGVVIGNEAVFTKEKYDLEGLTGMDMLRLALERANSAKMALTIITDLLETYGQGGKCGYEDNLKYHNSYIIADYSNAYILETAERKWVAKKIEKSSSISNCLTIETDFNISSVDLKKYAVKRGYTQKDASLNFKKDFSDKLFTHFAKGRERQAFSKNLLLNKEGSLTTMDFVRFLRDHNEEEPFTPGKKPMEKLCLHAGGLISSQTTGSMIVVLKEGVTPLIYLTGTSAPCLGIFKPHTILPEQKEYTLNRFSKKLPNGEIDIYGSAKGEYDSSTLWWQGEDIHRRTLLNFPEMGPLWQTERDLIEAKMIQDIEKAHVSQSAKKFQESCDKYSLELIETHLSAREKIVNKFNKLKKRKSPWWFKLYWNRMNKKANFNL